MTQYPKRIEHFDYEWVPPHAKYADLPPTTYRKETRKARFVLVSRQGDGGDVLDVLIYFVNLGDETLTRVDCRMAGFETEDEEVVTFAGRRKGYRNVKRGEAVLVDVININSDSDWSIEHYIEIESPSLGHIRLDAFRGKGKYQDMDLLWDNGEPAKNVYIQNY